jgi:hypothetical protein
LKIQTNIEEFECMEYICDQIIPITKFETLNRYLNSKVVDGILGWVFFMVYDIDIHQLNLEKCKNLKVLDEFHSKDVFFCIFLIMNA